MEASRKDLARLIAPKLADRSSHASSDGAATPIIVVAALTLASLLPFMIILPALRRLFFFGDDWGLLSDYVDVGLGRWLRQPFAENFAPAFKLVWIAAVASFHGSYLGLILLLWLSHAANVLLLGLLLRRYGFAPVATIAALLAFGLTWTNLESLTESPQLSQVLSVTLFLLTWLVWSTGVRSEGAARSAAVLVFVGSLASGLTFARGIIVGLVLTLSGAGETVFAKHRRDPLFFVAAFASTGVTLGATLYFSTGDIVHADLSGPRAIAAVGVYAAAYLALNPLLLLLQIPWQQFGATDVIGVPSSQALTDLSGALLILFLAAAVLALAKLCILVVGLKEAARPARLLLLTLVAFDIGNAAILGAGRSQLGFNTAFTPRYQYVSWLVFAPFLGLALQHGIGALDRQFRGRTGPVRAATIACLAALVFVVAAPWPFQAERAAQVYGDAVRQQISNGLADDKLPYTTVTVSRARQLVATFHLH